MTLPAESKKPTFSIVMPAYNAAANIAEAIDSVLGQTVYDWEMIIVDDGSADDTLRIIENAGKKDQRIRIDTLPANSGSAYQPRKRAIERATGRYIICLDADDTLEPRYLEKMAAAIGDSAPDGVFGTMYFIGETEDRCLPMPGFDMSRIYSGRELVKFTLDGWKIGANGTCINRSIYDRTFARYDTAVRDMNADELLTRQLLLSMSSVAFSDARYNYHITASSVSRKISASTFDILVTDCRLKELIEANFPRGAEERKLIAWQMTADTIDLLRLWINSRHDATVANTATLDKIKMCRLAIDRHELGGKRLLMKRMLLFAGITPLKLMMLLNDKIKGRK